MNARAQHPTDRSELAPRALADEIAALASDKKAIDVVELDVSGVLGYTDFFLICSGNTDRQVKAIHDGIHQGLKDRHGLIPRRVEGLGLPVTVVTPEHEGRQGVAGHVGNILG